MRRALVARVLIVGCGCRGRELAAALAGSGHAVRGTSRSADGLAAVEAAGVEPFAADPDRLGTMLGALEGVSAVCWLMGSARGNAEEVAALHGPRLQSLLDRLVDTPVRGLVYEAAGTVDPRRLEEGAAIVRAAATTHRMPVGVVDADPRRRAAWAAAVARAVEAILER